MAGRAVNGLRFVAFRSDLFELVGAIASVRSPPFWFPHARNVSLCLRHPSQDLRCSLVQRVSGVPKSLGSDCTLKLGLGQNLHSDPRGL
jgi:hypothetical protein